LCAAGLERECSKGRKLVDTSGGKLPAALERRTSDRSARSDLCCYISKAGNQSRSCFSLPRRSHSHSVLSSQQPKKTEDRRSSSAAIIYMPLKPITMGPLSLLLQIKWLRVDIICRTRSANSIRQDRLMRYLLKRK
jgi:hypothetical protein